jgi:hypothetical protein
MVGTAPGVLVEADADGEPVAKITVIVTKNTQQP